MLPENDNRVPPQPSTDYLYLPTGQPLIFNRAAVRPFQCVSWGWQLVKDQYMLYVGMFLIIVLVTCVGFTGLLWGAWMAGIYLALLGRMRGEMTSLNTLSKGFQYFGPAFLVSFLSGLPYALLTIIITIYERRIDEIDKLYPGETPLPPEVLTEMFGMFGGMILLYIISFMITGAIWAFAYPLIVEHGLSGWEATKASARAARQNLGGVIGLLFLDLALSIAGFMLCCIGLAFTMPVTKAAWAVAYRQVFPAPPPPPQPNPAYPPPPPAYGNPAAHYRGPLGL